MIQKLFFCPLYHNPYKSNVNLVMTKHLRADVVGVIVTGVGDTILHLISLSADKSLHPPPDWSAGQMLSSVCLVAPS